MLFRAAQSAGLWLVSNGKLYVHTYKLHLLLYLAICLPLDLLCKTESHYVAIYALIS